MFFCFFLKTPREKKKLLFWDCFPFWVQKKTGAGGGNPTRNFNKPLLFWKGLFGSFFF